MINLIKPIIPELTLATGICLMVLVNALIKNPHKGPNSAIIEGIKLFAYDHNAKHS